MKICRKYVFLSIFVSLCLSGCGVSSLLSGPTPDVPKYGTQWALAETDFPRYLNCSLITSTSPGPEIGGLRIGVSTFEQVKETLRPTHIEWNQEYGYLSFEDLTSLEKDERSWGYTQTCFNGDKLSAISTGYRDSSVAGSLQEWLDIYGRPDIVTWGSFYGQRSMIWAEEGLLAVLDIYFEDVSGLVLFTPIPIEELGTSWLMQALPEEGQECPVPRDEVADDAGCFDPSYEIPDPLGLGKLTN